MRTFLPAFELQPARDLDDALRKLASEPGVWRPFAGGTDLMVLMEAGKLSHRRYVSVWGLSDLRRIEVSPAAVSLGALTTYSDVLRHPVLREEFPMLCRAAAETGGIATQNRGTIGGNIANASPAADMPPALVAYDAELELASVRGNRRVPYDRFHTGYKVMDLASDEIVRAIHLPRGRSAWRSTYRKVGTRRAQAISKVCLAAAARTVDGVIRDVRIGLGSVAPTVVRAVSVEKALDGRRPDADTIAAARSALARDISPIDDLRSTARYRLHVAENLLGDFLAGLT